MLTCSGAAKGDDLLLSGALGLMDLDGLLQRLTDPQEGAATSPDASRWGTVDHTASRLSCVRSRVQTAEKFGYKKFGILKSAVHGGVCPDRLQQGACLFRVWPAAWASLSLYTSTSDVTDRAHLKGEVVVPAGHPMLCLLRSCSRTWTTTGRIRLPSSSC